MSLSRRKVLLAMTMASALGVVRTAQAQQMCSQSGPSLDEILQAWNDAANQAERDKQYFNITLDRVSKAPYTGSKEGATVVEDGVIGRLSVNGRLLGDTLENHALRIAPGVYRGRMRYVSGKNFVQGSLGEMAQTGDFLLEVVDATTRRTDLLVHTGNKPWHSRGCILAGAAVKQTVNGKTQVRIADDSTLKALRLAFYGTDTPNACPAKTITFTINDL